MDKKIGFYGAGNMAEAIINGLIRSALYSPDQIIAYDVDQNRVAYMQEQYEISFASDEEALLKIADICVLAIKPQILPVLESKPFIKKYSGILISVLAGTSVESLGKVFSFAKIVRTMPNAPALVAEGMTGICYADDLTVQEKADVDQIFSSVGEIIEVKEEHLAAVTGISGSGPAYVFVFAEAMADAAVLCGLSRKDAYLLAAQTIAGSAAMIQKTGKHPGELKDMVTSPGGTTIEAIKSLEENGFRNAVMEAVISSYQKSKQL